MEFLYFVLFVIALRLNSLWERRVEARRILHGLILPLYHYLAHLDHELQGEVAEINNLYRQAVLDHVTELRAFLLQPESRDLALFGKISWAVALNNILMAIEESLELEEDEDLEPVELNAQVSHLLKFIQENKDLSSLVKRPLGVVQYTEI